MRSCNEIPAPHDVEGEAGEEDDVEDGYGDAPVGFGEEGGVEGVASIAEDSPGCFGIGGEEVGVDVEGMFDGFDADPDSDGAADGCCGIACCWGEEECEADAGELGECGEQDGVGERGKHFVVGVDQFVSEIDAGEVSEELDECEGGEYGGEIEDEGVGDAVEEFGCSPL